MSFLDVYKHLLPTARAWQLTIDKRLRQFFQGISGTPQDSRDYFDQVFNDIDPQLTRALPEWENQFGLWKSGVLSEQDRRDRLDAAWKRRGGQDPRYLQDTLQAAGFPVFIHEFWELPLTFPPTVRNPNNFLSSGNTGALITQQDGGPSSQDGGNISQDGAGITPQGYPLVNKIFEQGSDFPEMQDGAPATGQDGNPSAQDGSGGLTFRRVVYTVSTDPDEFPFYLYIGGEVFPEVAIIPNSRRDEFEALCLQICPLEQWLGILVLYS